MVINADGPETRVALIEKGQLAELYIERRRERGIVGNIYKGRVKRVLPGMQAAFVDIGVEKAAFLYVADVRGAPEDFKSLFIDDDEERARTTTDARQERRAARASRTWSRRARRSWSRSPRTRSAPRARAHRVHLAARPPPGVHADRQPRRHLAPHRHRQGAQAAARDRRVDAARGRGLHRPHRRRGRVARTSSSADMEFLIKLWNSILAKQKQTQGAGAALQRPRSAAAHGARSVHPAGRQAHRRRQVRVRAAAQVRRRVHAATSAARSSSTTGASRSSTATASRARSTARSSARCG